MSRTPFSQQIAYWERGHLDADATEMLAELVQQVRQTRRKGTLTLTVTVSMQGNTETVLSIATDVAAKPPKVGRRESIMFTNPQGDLLRDDPEQMTAPGIAPVDPATGEILNGNS